MSISPREIDNIVAVQNCVQNFMIKTKGKMEPIEDTRKYH